MPTEDELEQRINELIDSEATNNSILTQEKRTNEINNERTEKQ